MVGDADQGQFQAEVTVRTRDGLVIREVADAGVPERDLERQEERLKSKFTSVATPVIGAGKAERLMSAVLALDSQNAIQDLMADASC